MDVRSLLTRIHTPTNCSDCQITKRPSLPYQQNGEIATTAGISEEHLIVAGGTVGLLGADRLNRVEVMDTKNLVWSIVTSLPHPYSDASNTICGDQLYMLGRWDDKGRTKSVLICSPKELLQSSPSSSSIIINGKEFLMPQLTAPPVPLSR